MKLKKHLLRIPDGKIENYLLNINHPEGVFKAMFFIKYGFVPSNPNALSQALIKHALVNDVFKIIETEFGTKYVINGKLETPENNEVRIITIWFKNLNEDLVNLVTAYPEKKMIAEFQKVILTIDLPEFKLVKGDIGIVVMVHENGSGYEVEFITLDGETIAVSTLKSDTIRAVAHKEIAHVRNLKVA